MARDGIRSRQLLPKALSEESVSPTDSPETPSHSEPSSNRLRARPEPASRSNVRSACLACKRRKCKCSGGFPCTRCQALRTECTYDESHDGRSKAFHERRNQELDMYKTVVAGVFRALREGDKYGILEMIRQHATPQAVAGALEHTRLSSVDSVEETSMILETVGVAQSSSGSTSSLVLGRSHSTVQSNQMRRGSAPLEAMLPTRQQRRTTGSSTHISSNSSAYLSSYGSIVPDPESMEFRHLLQPIHCADTSNLSRLSHVYLNFCDAGQQMITSGIPEHLVLGTVDVNCSLLFRLREPTDPFDVAGWACDIINGIPGLDIYFRLAWLFFLARFMRWSIATTKENFELLPDNMKPSSLQLSLPHVPAIDLAILPSIRHAMMENLRDFSIAQQLAGVSVQWTASIQEAVRHEPSTGVMTITERFARHVCDTENLLFGRRFLEMFPELKGHLNISQEEYINPAHNESQRIRTAPLLM